jgi:peptidyl-prolyl cis-trans isomerase A (cyclophilin A)
MILCTCWTGFLAMIFVSMNISVDSFSSSRHFTRPRTTCRAASANNEEGIVRTGLFQRRTVLQTTSIVLAAGVFQGASNVYMAVADADVSITTDSYKVLLMIQLDTKGTTGEIEIEVLPSWAPIAASRFRKLVEIGFYNDAKFFRVLPGYVAQFGIASDPTLNKEWIFCERNCKAIADEPRRQSNKKGTLSFASSGKNSRQTQVFINLNDNDGIPNFLDAQGFVPFARVSKGMDTVVNKINGEYGLQESLSGGLAGSVNQGKASYYGKEYLDALFPKLSFIQSAKIL